MHFRGGSAVSLWRLSRQDRAEQQQVCLKRREEVQPCNAALCESDDRAWLGRTTADRTKMKGSRTGLPLTLALLYGAATGAAVFWMDRGGNPLGGLAFALDRIPRELILTLGGPDPARMPAANALLAAIFVFLVALLPLMWSTLSHTGNDVSWLRRASPAIGLCVLLLYGIVELLLGDAPRYAFGSLRYSLFLPWHLVALGLTVAYLVWLWKASIPSWVGRAYWFTLFGMALLVLFPISDSL